MRRRKRKKNEIPAFEQKVRRKLSEKTAVKKENPKQGKKKKELRPKWIEDSVSNEGNSSKSASLPENEETSSPEEQEESGPSKKVMRSSEVEKKKSPQTAENTKEKEPSVQNKEDPEEKRKKEEKKKAQKEANVPAEHIKSEQVTKPEEKLLGKFRKHPVIFLRRVFLAGICIAILIFILSPLQKTRFDEVFAWLLFGILLFGTAIIMDLYLRWKLNVNVFTEERIISVEHNGALNHVIEIIPIPSIKYIDLKQQGFFKTLLNYGDIHITSFITESNRDMTLTSIQNVKKAFTILQKKAYAVYKT